MMKNINMDIKQTYSLDMYILYLSFLDFDSKYIEELASNSICRLGFKQKHLQQHKLETKLSYCFILKSQRHIWTNWFCLNIKVSNIKLWVRFQQFFGKS